jgi:pimeloyl-ACP methyl ester carboxylesterase
VLLLHGIGSNSRSFRHQLADLCDSYTVIAWDAPGYGHSDDPVEPFTLADLADRAVGLLDELEVERAHVLGVSMGGVIAQLVYHRHPHRVRSLILADTNPGGGGLPEPERSARVQGRLEALERLGPRGMAEARAPHLLGPDAPADLLKEVTEIMAEVRPAGYRAAAIALGQTDLTALLETIDVPTLVIHGEHDTVVPPDTGRFLAENIPGARLVLIPNAGHVSNQEHPQAFNAAVRQFLRDCG